jgi:membrane-bound lytic murein transglycosylase B
MAEGDRAARRPHGPCRIVALAGVLCLLLLAGAAPARAQAEQSFSAWLAGFRTEAAAAGISRATLDRALTGLTPNPRVAELDDRQPQFTITFWDYIDNAISDSRIAEGQRMLAQYGRLLGEVEARYGVPARFLVAFWGLETGYGSFMGDFSVIRSLATLAHRGRRGDMFRSQLLDALRMVDRGYATVEQLRGSWAGAMGHTQFMPGTYMRYAVDADGDGRRNIWSSLTDVFASSANYLSEAGWQPGETWGREVRVPAGFDWSLADLSIRLPLSEWQARGVRRMDGGTLPAADMEASLILPMGHQGPAFLVYDNFRVIMEWNHSVFYAVSVGHLADRLIGAGPLAGPRPAVGRPLSAAEVEEMQRLLAAHGFDPGEPDGRSGPLTRAALRSFQSHAGLPADGFPTLEMLARLRRGAVPVRN